MHSRLSDNRLPLLKGRQVPPGPKTCHWVPLASGGSPICLLCLQRTWYFRLPCLYSPAFPHFLNFSFLLFAVLGLEPNVWHTLGKLSATAPPLNLFSYCSMVKVYNHRQRRIAGNHNAPQALHVGSFPPGGGASTLYFHHTWGHPVRCLWRYKCCVLCGQLHLALPCLTLKWLLCLLQKVLKNNTLKFHTHTFWPMVLTLGTISSCLTE
jgi:hypothetical protein